MANITVVVAIYGDLNGSRNRILIHESIWRWYELLSQIPTGRPCLCLSLRDVHKDESVALVRYLNNLLSKHSEIQSLTLPTHKFTNEAWIELASALPSWKHVKKLVLRDNGKSTRQDMVSLTCRALPRTNICTFTSCNYLFDGTSLTEALQTNLTHLYVLGKILPQLMPLKDHTKLEYLCLYGNLGNIPDHTLDALFSHDIEIEGDDSRLLWFKKRNLVCKELAAGNLIRDSIPLNLAINDIKPFVSQMISNSEQMRAMKLVVLGHERIGKTTLLNAMHQVLDPTFRKDPASIKSTVGVDCTSFDLAKAKIAVWDFAGQLEYTVTHSFFLSTEMISIVVCFNLALSLNNQKQQASYWLDFLSSSLPVPPLAATPKWNIILVGVQADQQRDYDLITNQSSIIKAWKRKWQNLPIAPQIFAVSALKSTESVQRLLQFVEEECNHIMDAYPTLIPSSYRQFLANIKDLPKDTSTLHHWRWLFERFGPGLSMQEQAFKTMLRCLHIIGQVVWLPSGTVFTDPTVAPKIAAKFVSPKEVRLLLLKQDSENVQILDSTEIGCLLDIDTANNERLSNELELLCHLRVCFKLQVAGSGASFHLFPSLSASTAKFRFSSSLAGKPLDGIQFVAPQGTIFVQGFICQFLVSLFSALNIYKSDIITVIENGAVVRCPGLFVGEMIVMNSTDHRIIVIAVNARDPDTSYAVGVFDQLIKGDFPQYSASENQILCTECLNKCFCEGQVDPAEMGIIRDQCNACTTFQHTQTVVPMYLRQTERCNAHEKDIHDVFINYRVFSEGVKSSGSYMERSGGLVEHLYQLLAVSKTRQGKPIHVFWDKKCLNDGHNWEVGFTRGLHQSRAIVLLMSNQAMMGIIEKAKKQQDNVLVEYEAALLLHKKYGVPVFPVFLAEISTEEGGERKFTNLNFGADFPDEPHLRGKSVHDFISELSSGLPSKHTKFLDSIKETMAEVFKCQGAKMPNRLENEQETKELVERIVRMLDKAPYVSSRPISNLLLPSPSLLPVTEEKFSTSTQALAVEHSISSLKT